MEQNSCENILGYSVTTQDATHCVNQICSWIDSGEKGKYAVCVNPHSLEIVKSDPLFRDAVLQADLLTPDGAGILIASRLLKGRIDERVTGSDIFWGLSRVLNQKKGYRFFFLGSTDENLEHVRKKMNINFPSIEIAGIFSPPFKSEFSFDEISRMIEAINRVRPHVLWVGMTAPKQEKWIYRHKDQLDVSFIGPVGAVFSFLGGSVKRSHPWFQNHGLEWLPRLLRQPCHLWQRTLISAPSFLLRVLKQRFSEKQAIGEEDRRKLCSSSGLKN